MSDFRNRTDKEWMRTPLLYDLERVVEFYRQLWDTKDHLTREELEHAPYKLCGTIMSIRSQQYSNQKEKLRLRIR